MTTWNPDLYLKFGGERTRAAADLLARVPVTAPARVIDLGCGPGNSTALLRARWPGADITGLDNDPAMLVTARASDPGVRWVEGDAAVWTADGPYDVVFSNAALHWLPDQTGVLHRWFRAVASGGTLAVQLPVVHPRAPLHRLVGEVAEAFGVADSGAVCHTREFYYDALAPHAAAIDLWKTEYAHAMDGPDAVLAWLKGARLRPMLAALPDDETRGRFEAELRERLAAAYPPRADGRVLFPFPRLFFVATRS